jgi:hypothetical protein
MCGGSHDDKSTRNVVFNVATVLVLQIMMRITSVALSSREYLCIKVEKPN